MSTLKRVALCLGAFILACSMVTGCGKSKDEKRTEEPAAATASAGETTTSKVGGDNETSATPKVIQTPRPTAGNSGSAASAMPDKVQSELDDARSFMGAGMYDDAREMLGSVDVEALTDEQLAEYDEIQESLAEEPAADAGFTPEDAVRIAEEAYGITIDGDLSGLTLQTNSGGAEFYQMQVRIDRENAKKTINIYKNGDIEELSSEPIAFG